MFPTKCQGQNDRMGRPVISCFRQNLDFSIGFATKISTLTLPPLLRFLCLINSFYRKYVSCVYNISNISNIYSIYSINPNLLPASIYFSNAGGVAHVQTTTKRWKSQPTSFEFYFSLGPTLSEWPVADFNLRGLFS